MITHSLSPKIDINELNIIHSNIGIIINKKYPPAKINLHPTKQKKPSDYSKDFFNIKIPNPPYFFKTLAINLFSPLTIWIK